MEVEEFDAPLPPEHHGTEEFDVGGGVLLPNWGKEVEEMKSTLDNDDILQSLCRSYGISNKDYKPISAKNGWGPCKTMPRTICVYESMLEAGVRFPLHNFYAKFLRQCNIAPSQLTPNAWRYLVAFLLLCERNGVQPMVSVFLHYFKLYTQGGKLQEGWHHVVPYPSRRLFKKCDNNLPSNDGWKKRFFFLEALSPVLPWRCPEEWGTLKQAVLCACVCHDAKMAKRKRELKHEDYCVCRAEKKAIEKLELVKEKWSISEFLDKSRYDNSLPVLPLLHAPVKTEDNADAAASTPPQKRKYKALSNITSPEQVAIARTSSPPGFISPGSADGGGQSASHKLAALLTEMCKTEKELSDAKRQLLEDRVKYEANVEQLMKDLAAAEMKHMEATAKLSEKLQAEEAKALQLGKELQEALEALGDERAKLKVLRHVLAQHMAAEAEHEAKVHQLKDELQAERAKSDAKVLQLGKELEAERVERAAEVKARVDSLVKNINAEHKSSTLIGEMLTDKYVTGFRNMRDLVLTLYPGVVDPAKLMLEALLAESILPGSPPPQASADQ